MSILSFIKHKRAVAPGNYGKERQRRYVFYKKSAQVDEILIRFEKAHLQKSLLFERQRI